MRSILFLDFDDVICLSAPYGGYDAKFALVSSTERAEHQMLWDSLFDEKAAKNLRCIHNEFNLCYVLSTSWWWLLNLQEIVQALRWGGLDFVADNLHEDWATPKEERSRLRSKEISDWLATHPEANPSWVIVDDTYSGPDLLTSKLDSAYVVMCRPAVGLQEAEAQSLFHMLQRRREELR